ncbi:MAG TPA: CRISPR-associated endonuclease Cas3'' [Geobacterales bacterium]|nr:CRISPR-associated endonuclease Cas3'' [Geobacterales bacterium]
MHNRKFYARYDCNEGNIIEEDLIEHLKNTGELAKQIAAKVLPTYVNAARIAGDFHDLFKVVYQDLPDCSKNSKAKLSFRYHEILSGVFLANYYLKIDDLGLGEDEIKASVRAVLLHHQGLRAISYEDFIRGYSYIRKRIYSKGISVVLQDVQYILEKLNYKVSTLTEDFLKFESILKFLEGGKEEYRLLCGILILADNYTVMKKLKTQNRLIDLEILDFLETLGIK